MPLVALINGQKITVGKAFFDPATGDIRAMVDKNCPQPVKQALLGSDWEFSLAPAQNPGTAFARLLTTTHKTTTLKEG